MKNDSKVDPEKLTEAVMERLLQDSAVSHSIAELRRILVALSDELVKKITKAFIAQVISDITDDVEPVHMSEQQNKSEEKANLRRAEKKTKDWSKMSDDSLRHAYLRRKKLGQLIEQGLNDELSRRFPGYDKEKQKFTHSKSVKKDWTKSSKASLRSVYYRNKKLGKPITPELNEELARRFPGYDKEKQKFTNRLITDWSTSSKESLRSVFSDRKKSGKPIEPELSEELARRFPGYDKEKQEFTSQVPTDWSKLSDACLRQVHRVRVKSGKMIETELNEELARRFPGYNKETQIFGKKDWTKSSDNSLRIAHSVRKKSGKPIEPELNEELARRFSGYDKATSSFGKGRKSKVKKPEHSLRQSKKQIVVKTKTTEQSLSKTKSKKVLSDLLLPLFITKDENYSLFIDGRTRPVLRGAKTPYELYLFDEKTSTAVVRKKTGVDAGLLYLLDIKNGKIADMSKGGVPSVLYNSKRHTFYLSKSAYFVELYGVETISNIYKIPFNVDVLKANRIPLNTVIIDKDGKEVFCSLVKIADKDGMLRQNKIIKYLLDSIDAKPNKNITAIEKIEPSEKRSSDVEKVPVVATPVGISNIEIKEEIKYKEIVVTVKHVKTTLDGVYSNVFVNGRKLVSNHIDTKIQLFGDGRILGIHGTVTDNISFPTRPMWLVYDTDLKLRAPQRKDSFSDYNVYVYNVGVAVNGLYLDVSNKSKVFLDMERIKKQAGDKRFVIGKEK